MPTRLLSIAFACFFGAAAEAQLASDRFSPLNNFGRYHGLGYSDGYHACKDGRCKTGSSWTNWTNWTGMSTLYSEPTPPPNNRVVAMGATSFMPRFSQEESVTPIFNDGIDISSQALPTPSPRMQMHPTPQGVGVPKLAPSPPSLYETVPAAPRQSQPSASDRMLELPAPPQRLETISPAPEVQPRRVPPGTNSLIQQSAFRLR